MSKLPLVEGVIRYTKENNISFCMPGHNGGLGFLKTPEGRRLYENFIKGDITEVDGVDNLHHPEGIIKESLELLSKLYGSKKSYFLVNGSTSGNLAMIFSCFNEGDKIIVERNCHRSIFNGIVMRKLTPLYIKNIINDRYNAPLSIDMEHFLYLIRMNKDAKGIVLTYPNYYGVCADLLPIIKEAKKYDMKVLIDSAHGAHFGFNKKLPESALKLGADIVVMSAHKTLPSLTQTAYLHIGQGVDVEKVDFYVSAFTSTSPSYMLMCSLDYARFYMEQEGEKAYKDLIEICNNYRNKINTIKGFHIIGEEDIYIENIKIDPTRYVINVEKGFSGFKLFNYLNENGIIAELSDNSNVVLIFSPFNEEGHFHKLYEVLSTCDIENLREDSVDVFALDLPYVKIMPYEAMERQNKRVLLNACEGRISALNIVPYPPGIPIVMMGEVISKQCINMIQYYLKNKVTVLGIFNDNNMDYINCEYYIDVVEEV